MGFNVTQRGAVRKITAARDEIIRLAASMQASGTDTSSLTPPLVEIKALGSDVTGVKITHGTTGFWFNYSGTITAGATLSVDCADFKAVVNGTNALNQITGTLDMNLEPGANNMVYEGPTTGVDINFVWLPRWV